MKNNRTTIAKSTIQELIEHSDVALSQPDIQAQVGDLCNRVTIYRVLDRLVEEGAIHKIIDIDGLTKFMSCHQCEDDQHHKHHHIHFHCSVCNNVTCLHHVIPQFNLPKDYIVKEVNFMVSGICENCN